MRISAYINCNINLQLQFTPPSEGLGSVIEAGALAIDIDIVFAIKLSTTKPAPNSLRGWFQTAPKRLKCR